jgi:hypothetical protein
MPPGVPLFYYQRPSDNVATAATITVDAGTEDPDYPAAYLKDGTPTRPAKLLTTTGRWVLDYGAPQRIDLVSLIHHNLIGGLNVRLKGNATNAWTAPTVNVPFVIPAAGPDGWRWNPWLDVALAVPVIASRTLRYWAIDVIGTNTTPVALGEVWTGKEKRTLTRGPSWGSTRIEDRPMVRHETDFGIELLYDRGAKIRSVELELIVTDDELADLKYVWDDARGGSIPWLAIPADDVDDGWLLRFNSDRWSYERITRNENKLDLNLREVGRGLYLS